MRKPDAEYIGIASCERIIPALAGKYHFAGKITHFKHRLPNGELERATVPVGEVWGETESEAETKARAEIQKWADAKGVTIRID